jgi:hypothetical protein
MKRNKHNLSHYKIASGDMGKLYPVGCYEVLPGDSIQQASSALMRVSPLINPVMHPVEVRIHHHFVATRLLWSGWEDFITGKDESTPIPTITIPASPATNAEMLDVMGVPMVAGMEINALPVRAVNKVYNDMYRDQDLVTEVSEDSVDIQNIAWAKDRFTAARPWTQTGNAVSVPLGSSANIMSDSAISAPYFVDNNNNASNPLEIANGSGVTQGSMYADLSNATGANINDIRRAFGLQRYKEARALYGDRYVDYLRYLGIRPSDGRLQRTEYLGGGKQTISFSEVLQTGLDSTDQGLGTMGGHGIAALRSNKFRRFFEEHGFVITMISVRPKAIYAEGLHKMWSREDIEDYYQKELEYIGQEAVLKKEVYADGTAADDETLGYSERYQDYREMPSTVVKEFRPGQVLEDWTMARDLSTHPTLNQSFIECEPTKRIHAVQSNDVLWMLINHNIVARRLVGRGGVGRIM